MPNLIRSTRKKYGFSTGFELIYVYQISAAEDTISQQRKRLELLEDRAEELRKVRLQSLCDPLLSDL